ncbi:MAG: ABC transporter ATP-binding protein, partial [Acidimicrobiales bacterium]
MSPDGTVVVTHLWKRFKADRSRALLRDELQRLRARLGGGEAGAWRWVLRDVNFSVQPGEAVGVVGVNGSGKSTLLKILTQVMYPYAGTVEVVGRVGALIEVRAGIHPDLTGRENAYLFGTLLGLPRKEVVRRFDDIVAFAELEDAIDRQVKFYSSGMQMRLGFAVAAFLEPDVLLVDEVLAVGDATFQQKCLDRMRQVIAEGTTLVFVSHDLQSVEAACPRGVWLREGRIAADGPVKETLAAYREAIEAMAAASHLSGRARLVKAEAKGVGGPARTQEPLEIRLVVESDDREPAVVHIGITEGTASPVFSVRRDLHLAGGQTEVA